MELAIHSHSYYAINRDFTGSAKSERDYHEDDDRPFQFTQGSAAIPDGLRRRKAHSAAHNRQRIRPATRAVRPAGLADGSSVSEQNRLLTAVDSIRAEET